MADSGRSQTVLVTPAIVVDHEQRFEIFFNSVLFLWVLVCCIEPWINSALFSVILYCIALLVLLVISCLTIGLWFVTLELWHSGCFYCRFFMLLCCRDSLRMMDDDDGSRKADGDNDRPDSWWKHFLEDTSITDQKERDREYLDVHFPYPETNMCDIYCVGGSMLSHMDP